MQDKERFMKVFLGGTCNGSLWRDELIGQLGMEYFNPVVKDWTLECAEEELKQREECDYCLYVITPRMSGVYSIAEVVDDSNKRPEKTLLCILPVDSGYNPVSLISFTSHQTKSLSKVANIVIGNGGAYFTSLESVATYLNVKEIYNG